MLFEKLLENLKNQNWKVQAIITANSNSITKIPQHLKIMMIAELIHLYLLDRGYKSVIIDDKVQKYSYKFAQSVCALNLELLFKSEHPNKKIFDVKYFEDNPKILCKYVKELFGIFFLKFGLNINKHLVIKSTNKYLNMNSETF